jgi:hypothetical protein
MKRIVYGELWGNLVFLPEDVAREYLEDYRMIAGAKSYGEARALRPKRTWVPDRDAEDEYGDPIDDSKPYDARRTGAFEEGEWPAPPDTLALYHWPEDVDRESIAVEKGKIAAWEYLSIDPTTEAAAVAKFREHGYSVTRDDELIMRLDAFWDQPEPLSES